MLLWIAVAALANTPPPIVGGIEVEQCAWPTVVAINGGSCTGTLIHPEVVLTAAHCGAATSIGFGDSAFSLSHNVSATCTRHPSYSGRAAHDLQVCKLSEPVPLAPTPPLAGCEVDELNVGDPVFIVGYGQSRYGSGGGPKRWAETTIVGLPGDGRVLAGTPEHSPCPGDSGGPVMVQLDDGAFRMFGTVTGGTTGIPCNGSAEYPFVPLHLDWIESTTGIDVTPCHDADGTWNPNEDCGGYDATGTQSGGSWSGWCGDQTVSDFSDTCGDAYGSEDDPTDDDDTPTDDDDAPTDDDASTDDASTDDAGSDDYEEEPRGGCGCTTGELATGWVMLTLAALFRRRRE